MPKTVSRCFVTLLLASTLVHAELRPPTPAEKKVVENFAAVMNKVLDQFQSDDWDEKIEYSIDDFAVNTVDPGVPLDIDEMMQRTYDVHRGSARFQNLIAPKMAGLNSPDMQEKVKAGRAIQDLMHVTVMVHFNRNSGGVNPPPAKNKDLQIPGAAYSYKINNGVTSHGSAYILLFGNWHAAKWNDSEGGYRFLFAHKQLTPYIENAVVEIYGADDRIQELLHKIDWNEVNNALTQ
jgi:hypothetical protein